MVGVVGVVGVVGDWSERQVLLTMATDEGDESFDPSAMGKADEVRCDARRATRDARRERQKPAVPQVVNERVGDNDFVFIKGCSASKARGLDRLVFRRFVRFSRGMLDRPAAS